jgi:solute carrier family 35 protein F5
LTNLVLFSPIVAILHFLKIEDLTMLIPFQISMLYVNGALSVGADYFLANTVVLTSPLIGNIGLSLTIPFSIVLDVVINHKHFGLEYVLGTTLVLSGFLFVNIDFRREHKEELLTPPSSPPGNRTRIDYTNEINHDD